MEDIPDWRLTDRVTCRLRRVERVARAVLFDIKLRAQRSDGTDWSARRVVGQPGAGQTVKAGQSRHFITLGRGRVVEGSVHEVIDLAVVSHDRLPDVDQLGRAVPDGMDPKQFAGLRMEQQLQHPDVVPDQLATCNFAIAGDADLEQPFPQQSAFRALLIADSCSHYFNDRAARNAASISGICASSGVIWMYRMTLS